MKTKGILVLVAYGVVMIVGAGAFIMWQMDTLVLYPIFSIMGGIIYGYFLVTVGIELFGWLVNRDLI